MITKGFAQYGHFIFVFDITCFRIGHPDYVHIGHKVAKAIGYDIDKIENTDVPSNSISNAYHDIPVVVIGQGNVALDCARVLSKGYNDLYETDITSDAIRILQNGVTDISVIGRRGHVQGAFTIKELRELTKLTDTHFMVQMNELELGLTSSSQHELSEGPHSKAKKRIDTLLQQVASEGRFASCRSLKPFRNTTYFSFLLYQCIVLVYENELICDFY